MYLDTAIKTPVPIRVNLMLRNIWVLLLSTWINRINCSENYWRCIRLFTEI